MSYPQPENTKPDVKPLLVVRTIGTADQIKGLNGRLRNTLAPLTTLVMMAHDIYLPVDPGPVALGQYIRTGTRNLQVTRREAEVIAPPQNDAPSIMNAPDHETWIGNVVHRHRARRYNAATIATHLAIVCDLTSLSNASLSVYELSGQAPPQRILDVVHQVVPPVQNS